MMIVDFKCVDQFAVLGKTALHLLWTVTAEGAVHHWHLNGLGQYRYHALLLTHHSDKFVELLFKRLTRVVLVSLLSVPSSSMAS